MGKALINVEKAARECMENPELSVYATAKKYTVKPNTLSSKISRLNSKFRNPPSNILNTVFGQHI